MKNIIFGILLHVVASIIDNSVMMCDEIIEVELSCTSKNEKQIQQILMKKIQPVKHKIFIFYLHFY